MLLTLWTIAMKDQLVATLRKVRNMITSAISASPVGTFLLLVVGVMGSPSPA